MNLEKGGKNKSNAPSADILRNTSEIMQELYSC